MTDYIAEAIAWHNEQFQKEKAAWEWVDKHLHKECDAALAKFVEVNPHQRGIQWWDVLSILRDCDAHLDVTEPMADLMGDDWQSPLCTFITFTMLYAVKLFATEMDTETRVETLRVLLQLGASRE